MLVVLDTNVLLVSISDRSPHHWIYKFFLEEKFSLAITTDIFAEYEEIITHHMGGPVADNVLLSLQNAVNTRTVTKYFRWDLIKTDRDDNKFVDCCIACNADYIVSEDRHFGVLRSLEFPKVNVLGIQDFRRLFST